MKERNDQEIKALLWERVGYERRGLKDRVAQIDCALAALGYSGSASPGGPETTAVEPPAERATMNRPNRKKRD